MDINFNANETLKKIGRKSWNTDNNGIIMDILEGVEQTSIYEVGREKPSGDLVWAMCLAFTAGQQDGIQMERNRVKKLRKREKRGGDM